MDKGAIIFFIFSLIIYGIFRRIYEGFFQLCFKKIIFFSYPCGILQKMISHKLFTKKINNWSKFEGTILFLVWFDNFI